MFKLLFADSDASHGVTPGEFTTHADLGLSMTANTFLLADLSFTKSCSRPCISNNNP